jgi:DNA-directed RNA polymerase specialized sigma24 family protein
VADDKDRTAFWRLWAERLPDLRSKSLLYEIGWYKNREIGEAFGLSYSAATRRVKVRRVKVTKERVEEDKDFRKRCQQIKAQINM